jgi:predicted TPR repeat methyltransferase
VDCLFRPKAEHVAHPDVIPNLGRSGYTNRERLEGSRRRGELVLHRNEYQGHSSHSFVPVSAPEWIWSNRSLDQWIRRQLKRSPTLDTLHVSANIGTLLERTTQLTDAGRTVAARPLLAALRALALPSPDFDLLDARLAIAEGAWDRALFTLDAGLDSVPSHAGLRKCRANVRHWIRDWEGAAKDAAEAVVADPSDPQAKAILGRAMLDLGHAGEAIACLQEAVSIAPANLDYRESFAVALEKSGEADAALQVLIDGIALLPGSVAMYNAAILLCVRRRDFGQALQLAEKARSTGVADACTLGMKGHALSSLGCDDEAAAAYREALNLGPEDPYVRHLVASSGAMPDAKRAPADYIRAVFDGYADRFESHISALEYSIPSAIRALLLAAPTIAAGLPLGPVLDLGCGTGLVALALDGLPVGPITGVDLSERMLCHARAKRLYTELRQGDILGELATHRQCWPLIVAADVLCYFGALDELLGLIHKRLKPGGWFIFSVEQIRSNHDGTVPGNGRWALERQGRYAHAESYINEVIRAVGFRLVQVDRLTIRQEAGAPVPGLLLAVERKIHDD